MLAATRPTRPDANGKRSAPATDADHHGAKPAGRAVVLRGCIMDGLFSHVHRATERVLSANGFELVEAPAQVCCGALHTHAGQHDEALALARHNVAAFDALPDDTVIVADAAGCGAMLKEYGRLLAGDPLARRAEALAARVRDVSEVLAERGPRHGATLDLRVAYDPPCHLLHAQRVAREPVAMLDAVAGIERVGHEDAEVCCGSAGSYSLVSTGPFWQRSSRARSRRCSRHGPTSSQPGTPAAPCRSVRDCWPPASPSPWCTLSRYWTGRMSARGSMPS